MSSSGKRNKFVHFLVVVQLIHRLTQADIRFSCTTTARLFFFPLLEQVTGLRLELCRFLKIVNNKLLFFFLPVREMRICETENDSFSDSFMIAIPVPNPDKLQKTAEEL